MSELALPALNGPQGLSMGLSGLSTLANTLASRQQQKAASRASDAERARQAALTQQARATLGQSIDRAGYERQQADTDKLRAALTQRFQRAQTGSEAPSLPAARGPAVVAEEARQRGEASAHTGQQAAGQAGLAALGDSLFRANIDLGRNATMLNQINDTRGASANILPLELAAAQHAGGGLRGLADLASLGGSFSNAVGAKRIQDEMDAKLKAQSDARIKALMTAAP